MKTLTKGNIVVEDIKKGDIHYEFQWSYCIKSKVITLPTRDDNGHWFWKSKNIISGKIIDYGVSEGLAHYAPNLYNYEAYMGCTYI